MGKSYGLFLLHWIEKADKLLILRGAAALTVIAYHVQDAYRATLKPLTIFGHDFSWLLLANGGMAVKIFFTLSGFLMFKAFYTDRYKFGRKHLPKFYLARIRRIVPLYYFLTFIFVVLVFPALLLPEYRGTLLSIVTFTYSGATPPQFAVPFWSLSTEVEFYILVPLLVLISRKLIKKTWHVWAGFVVVVGFGIMARWLTEGQGVSVLLNLVTSLDSFLIGGLVCISMYGMKNSKPAYRPHSVLALIVGILLFPLLSLYAFVFPQYAYALLAPTLAGLLVAVFVWIAESNVTGAYDKTVHPFIEVIKRPSLWPVYVGALSYGIYLWHMPIVSQIQTLGIIGGTGWKAMILEFLLVAVLSIGCSIWTYKYIENGTLTGAK